MIATVRLAVSAQAVFVLARVCAKTAKTQQFQRLIAEVSWHILCRDSAKTGKNAYISTACREGVLAYSLFF